MYPLSLPIATGSLVFVLASSSCSMRLVIPVQVGVGHGEVDIGVDVLRAQFGEPLVLRGGKRVFLLDVVNARKVAVRGRIALVCGDGLLELGGGHLVVLIGLLMLVVGRVLVEAFLEILQAVLVVRRASTLRLTDREGSPREYQEQCQEHTDDSPAGHSRFPLVSG